MQWWKPEIHIRREVYSAAHVSISALALSLLDGQKYPPLLF